jgi:hypothetical protein
VDGKWVSKEAQLPPKPTTPAADYSAFWGTVTGLLQLAGPAEPANSEKDSYLRYEAEQRLKQRGERIDNLIEKINEAERARRNTTITASCPWSVGLGIDYDPMSAQEKSDRELLASLIVQQVMQEGELGITLDELLGSATISASPDRGLFGQLWHDVNNYIDFKPWNEDEADRVLRPILAEIRDLAQLSQSIRDGIFDPYGSYESSRQVWLDIVEDPEGFKNAIVQSLDDFGNRMATDPEFEREVLIRLAAGELLTAGIGTLSKAAKIRLVAQVRRAYEAAQVAKAIHRSAATAQAVASVLAALSKRALNSLDEAAMYVRSLPGVRYLHFDYNTVFGGFPLLPFKVRYVEYGKIATSDVWRFNRYLLRGG